MTQPQLMLSVLLGSKDAALIEKVARLRLGVFDNQPVDVGQYIRMLVERDINAAIQEIRARTAPEG